MWPWIVDVQRDIYLAFAEHIKVFAGGGGTAALLGFLPMGILFGAIHALTPGHSKAILVTYVTGSQLGLWRALATALVLSATHVFMSVAIVLLALPLVSMAFGGSGPGSSPQLEMVSRGLLALVGVWMLVRAAIGRRHSHSTGEGPMFGLLAGLIPCPLTLFVMTFAVSRGVPEAGMMFAAVMMLGVALTLGTMTAVTVFARELMFSVISRNHRFVDWSGKVLEGISGILLIAVGIFALA